jgi:hypothetical protein
MQIAGFIVLELLRFGPLLLRNAIDAKSFEGSINVTFLACGMFDWAISLNSSNGHQVNTRITRITSFSISLKGSESCQADCFCLLFRTVFPISEGY